ncbi:MAG: hypothetical protein IJV86_05140 [Clostridia bacterium]|nr:hypothetical protein [Clostridia bacterium]
MYEIYRRFDSYSAPQENPIRTTGQNAQTRTGMQNSTGTTQKPVGGNTGTAAVKPHSGQPNGRMGTDRRVMPQNVRQSKPQGGGQSFTMDRVGSHGHSSSHQTPQAGFGQKDGCQQSRQSSGVKKNGFLQGLLPSSIYDFQSKKLFGILSAEDLLLIALIFLFLEKEDGDNTLMILALGYILLSDYIELPEIGL